MEARRRRPDGSPATPTSRAGSAAGITRMYSNEEPGFKIDPVKLLVMSMLFICSVFVLHIWGRISSAVL